MVRRRSWRKRGAGSAGVDSGVGSAQCLSVARLRPRPETDGRRFRALAVVDNCTRDCLALVADTSMSGVRVARALDRIIAWRGQPAAVTSDNVTELTSNAIVNRADERGVGRQYIESGKPKQKDFSESFKGGWA